MAQPLEARVTGLAARDPVVRDRARGAWGWDVANMALALRWGALCFAVISAFATAGAARDLRRDVIGVGVLILYGIIRTIQPLRETAGWSSRLWLCFEAALCTAVAALTGGWSSPMLLMVGCALLIAGLLGGLAAVGPALVTVLVLVAGAEAAGTLPLFRGLRSSIAVQRIPELAVLGAFGVYARRLFHAEGSAYNRLRWVNEMHGMLLELYAVAAEHPGLFTLEGAVQATVSRLREVLSSDVVAVLLRPSTAEGGEQPWEVGFAEGLQLGPVVANSNLPPALARCAATLKPELCDNLTGQGGMDATAVSGLYAPILVRGSLAGLLILERRRPPGFTAESREVIKEIAHHAGMAIDNARSLLRLRSLGAEEERERIARDLHDRVGQSLAAVAFNVDRITALLPPNERPRLTPELETLSREIRAVNGEIREKLTELRGGPTASVDIVDLLEGMLANVGARSELSVQFDHELDERLPGIVEREVWRIGCEAIRNAERHSGAQHLAVVLRSEPASTVLEVVDDGRGISAKDTLRSDAYGLVGMRERADLLGGTLVIDSAPHQGTKIRLRVPRT